TAIDTSADAVRVMRQRGVRDATVGNGLRPSGGPYETVLMMMNGIAIVKSITGLHQVLRRCRKLLAPGGQIVFDTLDLRKDDLSRRFARTRKLAPGRYHGEMGFRMAYKGRIGRRFQLLFIDPTRLKREAAKAGWRAQVVFNEGEGRYLARLVPLAAPRRK
ncbi:MAG TPA: SAM-dependent methyltransferase, partial [bacterium]